MTEVGLVLDTSAVHAYSVGNAEVGAAIARAADEGSSVLVPALSLAEGFRSADRSAWLHLEVLSLLPHVVIAPVDADHCMLIGEWARTLGSLDLAQAALAAAANEVAPIMTARRQTLAKLLPAEWPIIDL